jgi:hypothetical protein
MTFSFRKKWIAMLITAAGLGLSTGCLQHTTPAATVDRQPLIVDEAMQRRDWPRSVVKYANGETTAYPTGFVLQHNPKAPVWMPIFTECPLFLANIVAMPAGYVFTPPWERVTYPRGVVPPTYNAMPPLPPPADK